MCRFPLTVQHHAGGHGTGTQKVMLSVSPLGPALWGGSCPMGRSCSILTQSPAGFQLCSPSLPAGCWPQGSRPEPGGSCGTSPKPAVWTPRTAGRRKAPWLWVIDQLGRRETWVLEEGGEASSPHWCPTVSPGHRAGRAVRGMPPAPVPLSPGTPAHTRHLEECTHPGLQFVRRGGVGRLKEGGRGLHFPLGESPALDGL